MGASAEIAEHVEPEINERGDYPKEIEEEAGEEVDQCECNSFGIFYLSFDMQVTR